jgi:hypothetical protein
MHLMGSVAVEGLALFLDQVQLCIDPYQLISGDGREQPVICHAVSTSSIRSSISNLRLLGKVEDQNFIFANNGQLMLESRRLYTPSSAAY